MVFGRVAAADLLLPARIHEAAGDTTL
jgi:hypothetical protein